MMQQQRGERERKSTGNYQEWERERERNVEREDYDDNGDALFYNREHWQLRSIAPAGTTEQKLADLVLAFSACFEYTHIPLLSPPQLSLLLLLLLGRRWAGKNAGGNIMSFPSYPVPHTLRRSVGSSLLRLLS